ncbi:alpha-amylase family glycosyl hydrolase [Sphingomonas lenta]|uniref:Alpha-amylase n=1 Tax=Sphingomonas lenta TaxID=1141887 RepID=A0A2A2SKL2_9SPHN|nr:alpha-amylase family glycosyl hydrolase [Sphingomonas lenta]PAX09758.1 alpha-amylase [Sphingomonas lenta]
MIKHLALPLLALGLAAPALAQTAPPAGVTDYRDRLPEDEVIYFVLPDRFENGDPSNDRGGLRGGRLQTGFDPTHKGFFHGGDLKGLTARLDYIRGLGATAIWLGPIFKNKPVQGPKGQESAGYHGYWITDFTTVDPHLGTEADMKAFVDAAHARGMKVYMDIIANHTADVIQLRECGVGTPCEYRGRAAYPYQRRGGLAGRPINGGFLGDDVQTSENFARLTDPNYAYTPYVSAAERNSKTPAWLNDLTLYHNRGNSTFAGESSTMGDFSGLDDLMTEDPRVIRGMIEIFGDWIDKYGVDGFRIDTAQHVNPEFWREFVPAMRQRAKLRGIPNFHIFGEVAMGDIDPGRLAWHTWNDDLPTVLDFAFQVGVGGIVAEGKPTSDAFRIFRGDQLYKGGEETARRLPTFLGNHDAGRIGYFLRRANPSASDQELLARDLLGHAMLLTLRGVPTIYSGDEQGFTGDGGDQDAREDMFPSRVAIYNDNKLIGTAATTAQANFDQQHPVYAEIARLARVRLGTPALTRGRQVMRAYGDKPGLLAVSRFDPTTNREVLLAFNTSNQPITTPVEVEVRSAAFDALAGPCAAQASAPGSVQLTLPAFGYAVCAAR